MMNFAPTTEDYGLLAMPLAAAAQAYERLFAAADQSLTRQNIEGKPSALFHALEPLTMALDRTMLIAHGPTWTSYFANGLLGSDAVLPVSRIAAMNGCTGLRICRSSKATLLEVYESPERGGDGLNLRRTIYAAQDGKWTFGNSGTPYPFESTEQYTEKRIKDRFTPKHLDAMLDGLGAPVTPLPPLDQHNAVLFVQDGAKASRLTLYSYAQVQAKEPWKRN
ncbi:hypothetical protein [Yoonia rosea]|nr:hypothetical protein [Yoonia rosea]